MFLERKKNAAIFNRCKTTVKSQVIFFFVIFCQQKEGETKLNVTCFERNFGIYNLTWSTLLFQCTFMKFSFDTGYLSLSIELAKAYFIHFVVPVYPCE